MPESVIVSLASSVTVPPCETSEFAAMVPVLLITPPKRLFAALANMITLPSGAATRL